MNSIISCGKNGYISTRNAKNDTALHLGAISGSVEIIEILLYNGMCVDLRNGDDSAPLRLSGACCNLEATKTFVERGAVVGKLIRMATLHCFGGKIWQIRCLSFRH